MRGIICDQCRGVLNGRYPFPRDESADFCNEECYDRFYKIDGVDDDK